MTISQPDELSSAIDQHLHRFALCANGFTTIINNRLEVFSEIKSFEIQIPVPIINLIVEYKSEFEQAEWILKVKSRSLFMFLRHVSTEEWVMGIIPLNVDDDDVDIYRIMDEMSCFDPIHPLIRSLSCNLTELYICFDEDKYDLTLKQLDYLWTEMKSNLEDIPFVPNSIVPNFKSILADVDENANVLFNVIHLIPINKNGTKICGSV